MNKSIPRQTFFFLWRKKGKAGWFMSNSMLTKPDPTAHVHQAFTTHTNTYYSYWIYLIYISCGCVCVCERPVSGRDYWHRLATFPSQATFSADATFCPPPLCLPPSGHRGPALCCSLIPAATAFSRSWRLCCTATRWAWCTGTSRWARAPWRDAHPLLFFCTMYSRVFCWKILFSVAVTVPGRRDP